MKYHKKITLSAIAASFLVAQGLYSANITNDDKLVQDPNDKGKYIYKFNTGDIVKTDLGSSKLTDGEDRIKHLEIHAGEQQANELAFEGGYLGGNLNKGYSFNLTADKVKFDIDRYGSLSAIYVGSGDSVINAKDGVMAKDTFINIATGDYFNHNYNGSLTINGNLELKRSSVLNQGDAKFHVNGKVIASDTQFSVSVDDFDRVTNNGILIMTASKGFENGIDKDKAFTDISSDNYGAIYIHNKLVNISSSLMNSEYANDVGTITELDFKKIAPTHDLSDYDGLYETELVQKENGLYVSGNFDKTKFYTNGRLDFDKLNTALKKEYAAQKSDLEILYKNNAGNESGFFLDKRQRVDAEIKTHTIEISSSEAKVSSTKLALDEAKKGNDPKKIEEAQKAYDNAKKILDSDKKILDELKNRLTEYDRLIEEVKNKTANLDKKINGLTNGGSGVQMGQKGQIFASLAESNVGGKISATAGYIFSNDRVIDDIEKAGKSNAGNSALNSPVNAINISNEMTISNRLAKFSNPYSTIKLASLAWEKFAAGEGIASDSTFSYGARAYENNIWANVIGGANIIDSNSGSLYGVSVGYDRLIGEETILGAYLTYANSETKTSTIEQKSDNLQFGLYSRTLYNNSEFDFKTYAQFGWTDQNRLIAQTINSSDFTRKFLGASGSYGYVFDIGNDLYIKPLAGLNLYYSLTPNYNENGPYAQHVRSQSNFDASIEAGAEFRKYLSKESYIYATPKIEQYIITSGDHYTARFLGSPTSFTINGSDKKKTYGSLIVGGDVNIKNAWAFTFSAGVKHLLSGKVNNESETYLSGNIGLKYQF
ncbi:autotransporter domain-containing protein [Campylobacter coli]|nr:autotransporter domain-containing protein [Campylobacter coli]EFL6827417.1 autotransporter domain-containing protein [Campylobacter coli]EFV1822109.1 autotransporter domain-containing protein [Campylobacter coli]EGH6346965.1 autotransporter domain-containing protein [Campylobacter coli]EGS0654577.1 autotransporter domain-containing protein [Campylobacter coli]